MAAMKSVLLIALGLTSSVAAHGICTKATVNGKSWNGYNPWDYKQATEDTVGYRIPEYPTNPYVLPPHFGSPDIICHNGATPGNIAIEVEAGSEVVLQWTPWPVSHKGAIVTYIANCGNGPFADVKKESLRFVKIQEDGIHSQNPDERTAGQWASDTFIDNGSKVSIQIPSYVAPGNYVLRNEQIALHNARPGGGGAQLYPQCINMKVTGSGTDDLTSGGTLGEDLYKSTDPGFTVNLYEPVNYIIPGPPVYKSGGTYNSVKPVVPSASAAVTSAVIAPTGSPAFIQATTFTNTTVSYPSSTGTAQSYPSAQLYPTTTVQSYPSAQSYPTTQPSSGTKVSDVTPVSFVSSGNTDYQCSTLNIPNDATVAELLDALDTIDTLLKQKLGGKHRRRARDMRSLH